MFYLFYAKPVDPMIIYQLCCQIDLSHTDSIYGNSALHFADRNPTATVKVFQMLLNAGADINAKSKAGSNVLGWYLQSCKSSSNDVDIEVVKCMLRAGFKVLF